MGMTVKAIAAACQQRSERDPKQDRAHAYGYVARHVEERPGITLEQLARDLVQWIKVHERSAERLRLRGSHLQEIYKQQAAVYREILAWATGNAAWRSRGDGSGRAAGEQRSREVSLALASVGGMGTEEIEESFNDGLPSC